MPPRAKQVAPIPVRMALNFQPYQLKPLPPKPARASRPKKASRVDVAVTESAGGQVRLPEVDRARPRSDQADVDQSDVGPQEAGGNEYGRVDEDCGEPMDINGEEGGGSGVDTPEKAHSDSETEQVPVESVREFRKRPVLSDTEDEEEDADDTQPVPTRAAIESQVEQTPKIDGGDFPSQNLPVNAASRDSGTPKPTGRGANPKKRVRFEIHEDIQPDEPSVRASRIHSTPQRVPLAPIASRNRSDPIPGTKQPIPPAQAASPSPVRRPTRRAAAEAAVRVQRDVRGGMQIRKELNMPETDSEDEEPDSEDEYSSGYDTAPDSVQAASYKFHPITGRQRSARHSDLRNAESDVDKPVSIRADSSTTSSTRKNNLPFDYDFPETPRYGDWFLDTPLPDPTTYPLTLLERFRVQYDRLEDSKMFCPQWRSFITSHGGNKEQRLLSFFANWFVGLSSGVIELLCADLSPTGPELARLGWRGDGVGSYASLWPGTIQWAWRIYCGSACGAPEGKVKRYGLERRKMEHVYNIEKKIDHEFYNWCNDHPESKPIFITLWRVELDAETTSKAKVNHCRLMSVFAEHLMHDWLATWNTTRRESPYQNSSALVGTNGHPPLFTVPRALGGGNLAPWSAATRKLMRKEYDRRYAATPAGAVKRKEKNDRTSKNLTQAKKDEYAETARNKNREKSKEKKENAEPKVFKTSASRRASDKRRRGTEAGKAATRKYHESEAGKASREREHAAKREKNRQKKLKREGTGGEVS